MTSFNPSLEYNVGLHQQFAAVSETPTTSATTCKFDLESEIAAVKQELTQRYPDYEWKCREIGNGNINYIYIAEGQNSNGETKKILVKKALDFARINPEEFPLSVERIDFENKAYEIYSEIIPEHIPEIFFFDLEKGMLAMEYLTPHKILRQGLLDGEQYPHIAEHLGLFLARSLYQSSCFHLEKQDWERNVRAFAQNTDMRQIILNLNFKEPFYGSHLNQWTTPELDDLVADIQNDTKIKTIVNKLKNDFIENPESLAHGDLHSGSILVTADETRVFDTEFATYAPISFDIGMLLGNFVMTAFAAKGHSLDGLWIADLTQKTWDSFEKNFRECWKNEEFSFDDKMKEIWSDTLRLMGVEMIRRTIGVAHTADFNTISDREKKAEIEKNALLFAKELLLEADSSFPGSETLKERLIEAIS